jgi:tetratricopeptide (TPR) repeat protein
MGFTPPQEAVPKEKALAQQAVALDDLSSIAHHRLAGIKTWTDWDWADAEPEWRRALELDPNASVTHAYFAHFLAITGRIDEAVPHSERAIELDPFNALYHALYAIVLCGARRYDDAMAEARTAMTMQPDVRVAPTALECALVCKGMRDEHLAFQRERIANDPERLAALDEGFAEAGYEGAMRRVADLLVAWYEESGGLTGPSRPYVIAHWYLWTGDYSSSIDWLEKAFELRDRNLPYLFKPVYDPLRSDPRFQDLLRRMNLPQSTEEGG